MTPQQTICRECETVAHCTNHGCIPKQPAPCAPAADGVCEALDCQNHKPAQQEPVVCIGYWNQKTGAFYKPDQLSSAHQKMIDEGILRRCYIASSQRKPLTDEKFLELILRTGTQELVGVATFVGGSIQMQGKIGLLRSAKVIKEFVEAAHGIKGDA